jgi:hypothetical protein
VSGYRESSFADAVGELRRTTTARTARPDGWPKPLDKAALHGPAGRWAEAVQPFTEASVEGVLVSTLVAFGNAAGRSSFALVTATEHHANEFVIVCGETGSARKSEAMRLGCRPIWLADPGWESRVQRGFGSGEAIVDEVRDPVTRWDDEKEEEVVVDAGAEDKRLLIYEDELAGPLAVASRDGSTLSPLSRSAWDGTTLMNRTKAKKNVATGAHVSILAGITAEELARRVTASEIANGFLNRFLLVAVRRSKKLPRPRPIRGDLEAEYVNEFRLALRFARKEGAGRVRFDAAAGRRWDTAYEEELSTDRYGLAGAACARADAHTLRLSVLYALLDRESMIRPVHVEAALALWRYCEASARFVFGDSTGDSLADKVIGELRLTRDGLTRTEIRTLVGGRESEARIETALRLLERYGLARMEVETDTGGRPAERWFTAEAT